MTRATEDIRDSRALRDAFGAFVTGVTIVTTTGAAGEPIGLTANAFTSVSLNPPLLLVCISRQSFSLAAIQRAGGFAVNILAEDQQALSHRFAHRVEDRFKGVNWRPGPVGGPLLDGVCGWFDCRLHDQFAAGDHVILIGRVAGFDHTSRRPLGYARGGYFPVDR
ncbi:flavin reductase family protein [Pikeienuella sp. HZG-20]|uniref:flavin reductase family protein n=1 Tax=Paludibacillus litoralis TaxID=3133267 RepID=UPI0030EBFAB8